FQAEDGIRDFHVTGVQTCALPISTGGPAIPGESPRLPAARSRSPVEGGTAPFVDHVDHVDDGDTSGPRVSTRNPPCSAAPAGSRSEERRVGTEWRARGSPGH